MYPCTTRRTPTKFKQHQVTTTRPRNCYAGRSRHRFSCFSPFVTWTAVREPGVRNRDYTGMWVRRGSTNLMAGKVVFLRGLLSPIRVIDLMVMNPYRILFEVVQSALKSTYMPFLEAFFPLTSARKNLPSGSEFAARGYPSVRFSPLR
ncbi:hypothetical protein TNCV_1750361 [Trichonephila clavipes]|nr:hypothetical protein TNCV_1750361 [Trichonephila clavipes]